MRAGISLHFRRERSLPGVWQWLVARGLPKGIPRHSRRRGAPTPSPEHLAHHGTSSGRRSIAAPHAVDGATLARRGPTQHIRGARRRRRSRRPGPEQQQVTGGHRPRIDAWECHVCIQPAPRLQCSGSAPRSVRRRSRIRPDQIVEDRLVADPQAVRADDPSPNTPGSPGKAGSSAIGLPALSISSTGAPVSDGRLTRRPHELRRSRFDAHHCSVRTDDRTTVQLVGEPKVVARHPGRGIRGLRGSVRPRRSKCPSTKRSPGGPRTVASARVRQLSATGVDSRLRYRVCAQDDGLVTGPHHARIVAS